MKTNERMKRALSVLLAFCIMLSYVPTTAYAVTEDNLCEHHEVHTAEVCGYVEGEADCTYHCEVCHAQEPVVRWNVTIAETTNGTVEADVTTAAEGATVTLTVTPAEGYELGTLTVKQGETDVTVTDNAFTMPAGDVTVSATFQVHTHSTTAEGDTAATCIAKAYCSVCQQSYGELAAHTLDGSGKCSVCGGAFWTITVIVDPDRDYTCIVPAGQDATVNGLYVEEGYVLDGVEVYYSSTYASVTGFRCGYETVTIPGEYVTADLTVWVSVRTIDIDAHRDHIYSGAPTFTWAEDYSAATATWVCLYDGNTNAVDCTVTFQTQDATCKADGKTIYTATVTLDGTDYTDTQSVSISKDTVNHSPDEAGKCTSCGYQYPFSTYDSYAEDLTTGFYADLDSALTVANGVSSITVLADYTIGEGVSATLGNSWLVLSEGVTLTNNGTLTIGGTLTNNGTIVNNGTIFLPENFDLSVLTTDNYSGSGTVTVGTVDYILYNGAWYQKANSSTGIYIDANTPTTYYTCDEGYAIYDGNGTLTLNNATIRYTSGSSAYAVTSSIDLNLVLNDTSTITASGANGGAAIRAAGALTIRGDGSLTANGKMESMLEGGGYLGTGIEAKSLTISGGTVTVTGGDQDISITGDALPTVAEGATLTSNGTTTVGNKSYTWNGGRFICAEGYHSGGTATCTEKAICETCGGEYGDLAAHTMAYFADEDADTITYQCSVCSGEAVTFALVIPTGATYGVSPMGVPHFDCSDKNYNVNYPNVTIDGKENNYPTAAGTYAVVMTWGGKTVSGEYTISKADPAIGEVTANVVNDTTETTAIVLKHENTDMEGTLSVDKGQTLKLGDNEITWTFTPADTGNYITVTGTVAVTVRDTIAPTGTVTLSTDSWSEFLNTITFGKYFKETQKVSVTAADNLSGVAKVEYYETKDILDLDGVKALEDGKWTVMDGGEVSVTAEDAKQFIHYIRITDNSGNVSYLATNGAEFDTTAPVINGVETGKTYYTTQVVTVTDKNLETITLNGEAVTGTITLDGNKDASYTIVATDKAGNSATVTVTMAEIADIADPMDSLTDENVTSDDKEALEDIVDTAEELLKDGKLTAAEKEALEAAKEKAEALLDVVDDAAADINTENTHKVKNITSDNVKPEDKEDLEKAKEDLEKALEENPGNYTNEEKQQIQEEIYRINDAIETIEKVEDLTDEIEKLPDSVEPDDEEAAKDILDAKEDYDDLTDHEKSLIDDELKEKLDDLLADLVDYKIIKGDGSKWTKGSSNGLTFTANGPFSKFAGIEVDGKEVASTYYTAESGSTIITLKQSFLKRLSTGEHTITVLYMDGETSGTFKILAEATSPATGDDSNIMLWSGMLCVSTLGLVVLLADRKRRRSTK